MHLHDKEVGRRTFVQLLQQHLQVAILRSCCTTAHDSVLQLLHDKVDATCSWAPTAQDPGPSNDGQGVPISPRSRAIR